MKVSVLPINDNQNGWLNLLGPLPKANPLQGDHRFESAVIGAGYTGLAAARRLGELQPDERVVLIDAGRIGNNAAGRSSGFSIDQAHNIRAKNFAQALEHEKQQIRLNRAGQQALRQAINEHNIDCDWQDCGKIHGAGTDKGRRLLRQFTSNLDLMDAPYEWYDAQKMKSITGLDFYQEGLFTPGTQQVQPAAMVRGLAESLPSNVTVFEDSPITEVHYGAPHVLTSSAGTVRCNQLLLANNGFGTGFGFYQDHVMGLPTYASMSRELTGEELEILRGEETWGVIPAHPFGSTIRRIRENRILVRNIYAYAKNHNPTEAHRIWARKQHRKSFLNRFPMLAHVEFEWSWGGSLCLSDNGNPIFGALAKNVYGSLCHNGVGVARGTICGKLLAEQVAGEDSDLLQIMLDADPTKPYRSGYCKLVLRSTWPIGDVRRDWSFKMLSLYRRKVILQT